VKKTGAFVRILPRAAMIAVGVVTGCLMAGLGVAIRLQDVIPTTGLGMWYGTPFFTNMGWTAWRVGWALVIEGTFWVAAMAAWGTRNRWGWWTAAAAGIISLAFFPGGTLAGIFVLLMMIPFIILDRPWREAMKRRAEQAADIKGGRVAPKGRIETPPTRSIG
jgi:hypothetical protein